jgi:type II secretory ATPase GspE/PulE/Tfp pilus assembly ATPase PilB-like protein
MARQKESGERLGEALVNLGFVSSEDVARALAEQLGLPFLPGKRILVSPRDFTRRLPLPLAQTLGCLPLDEADDGSVVVATADPLNQKALEEVSRLLGRPVRPVVVLPEALDRTLGEFAPGETAESPGQKPETSLLIRARREGATVIHLESSSSGRGRVYFRVNGELRSEGELGGEEYRALLSRLKALASLDPEGSEPQEGFCRLELEEQEVGIRISICPTLEGERAVIRILSPRTPPRLKDLGLEPEEEERLRSVLEEGRGLVLVSSPPGNGLTSTWASLLSALTRPGRVILSAEEFIEHRLPGVHQVQVNRQAGLSFPRLVRIFLRQDPDVVAIGEIEEAETAEAAVLAALSGRLVLGAMLAPDATRALERLRRLGVDSRLLGSLLVVSLSQRMVPQACPACGGQGRSGSEVCPLCGGTGKGKMAPAVEILIPDDALRQAIAEGTPASELREAMRRQGWITWEERARRLLPPEEAKRIGLLV